MAKSSGGGESEWHVVAIRLRVTGAGNLKTRLSDYDNGQIQPLVDLPMLAATRFEPTRLANFQSQRVRVEGSTEEINETFRISRLVIFAKAVAIEYPQ